MSTLYEAAQELKKTLEQGKDDPTQKFTKAIEELGGDPATIEYLLLKDNQNKLTDYAFACLVTHVAKDK